MSQSTSIETALTPDDLPSNLADIQGGLLEENETTLAAEYVFYSIQDAKLGRDWLSKLVDQVTTSQQTRSKPEPEKTLNIAISAFGLAALGLADETQASFPHAFKEGMAARAKKLGDTGPSDPSNWEGGLGSSEIHVMVVLGCKDLHSVQEWRKELTQEAASYSISQQHVVDAEVIFEKRSGSPAAHFGFVDPVSQPAIAGLEEGNPGDGARVGDGWRPIAPGEFLLGYVNELGERTETPTPASLGINGSYIAFRKAAQDVAGFRDYLKVGAMTLWGADDEFHQHKTAANIVGRWKSGCPLALSPDKDDLEIAADPNRANNFDYADDPEGKKCPLGAHIRRVNPRSSKISSKADINRKRLLRRGLEFTWLR